MTVPRIGAYRGTEKQIVAEFLSHVLNIDPHASLVAHHIYSKPIDCRMLRLYCLHRSGW